MRRSYKEVLALGSALALCQAPAACVGERTTSIERRNDVSAHLDSIFRRDLLASFARDSRGVVRVEYELFRTEPTVTGIADPKYYAWVLTIDSLGVVSREGAARLALVDSSVEVTHFLPLTYLSRVPASVDSVFPPDVATAIRMRLRSGARSP